VFFGDECVSCRVRTIFLVVHIEDIGNRVGKLAKVCSCGAMFACFFALVLRLPALPLTVLSGVPPPQLDHRGFRLKLQSEFQAEELNLTDPKLQ
jgi:hypothetical protein